MPYLGDYLGQLMAEIAIARAKADLETVRLAEIYAADPLLRTMAVPRLRLPEVDLELPVIIDRVEEGRPDELARGGIALAEMRRTFEDLLFAKLERGDIAVSAADRKRLKSVLDDRLATYGGAQDTLVGTHRVAEEFSADAVQFLRGRPRRPAAEPKIDDDFERTLVRAVRVEFLKLRPAPPRLIALVTSAELQAVESLETATRLRIKLNEQGFEWTTIESDGVSRDRLVPE